MTTPLLAHFEEHLAMVKKREPGVHALVGWDEAAARRRAEAAGNGPLAGWAIGVKDIIDVKGLVTKCGVNFMPDTPAQKNAALVERLESLGAYVFSKLVTTVLASFDPGPTTNPWNAGYTPGGSSQGSAAAVATGMVRLSLGSQTIGSISRPASYCGIPGFKPTYERMSQDGLFPFSPSVDTIGFFTAAMPDMQVVCAAVFGAVQAELPSSLRIGVIADMYCEAADAEMLGAIRETAEKLKASGFDVQSTRLPETLKEAYQNHTTVVAGEVAVAQRELFDNNQTHYPPKVRAILLQGQQVSTEQLKQSLDRREQFQMDLDQLFDEFDLLLTPGATGAASKGLAFTGDPRMSLLFTHTGVPALTLPVKLNPIGLPLGVQIAARKMRDMELVAACLQIEQVIGFDARIPD